MAASEIAFPVTKAVGLVCLVLFGLLLVLLQLLASTTEWHSIDLFDTFYRAGSLVFGGGNVVLPLLQAEVVNSGWVSEGAFLAGYGVAQAVPGPLFTFAAYLGAAAGPTPNGLLGATIALLEIFLPGFLLLVGALPFWGLLNRLPAAQFVLRGANAAVVGVLGAALYDPVWTGAVFTTAYFTLALAGFLLLVVWKMPPWIVVFLMASVAVLLQFLSTNPIRSNSARPVSQARPPLPSARYSGR